MRYQQSSLTGHRDKMVVAIMVHGIFDYTLQYMHNTVLDMVSSALDTGARYLLEACTSDWIE